MATTVGRTVLLVHDVEEAADFYGRAFGFRVLHDADREGFRLLHIGPGRPDEAGLWLFPAGSDAAMAARIGNQTAGAPTLVLYLDDLAGTLDRLAGLGVRPHVPATTEPATGQTFAHVRDVSGNELVLVDRRP